MRLSKLASQPFGITFEPGHPALQPSFKTASKDIVRFPDMWLPPDPGAEKKYYKFRDYKWAERGPYRLQPLATTSNDERPNLRYPITLPDGREIWPEKQWQWSNERVQRALANGELVATTKNNRTSISYKQYLRDIDGLERGRKPTSIITGHYTQHGTSESVALFGQEGKFQFPKPEGLLETVIEGCTQKGDLVLDSFAGSGTTGAVAHKMGRRWIMVELGEHAKTHIVPRLRKVIDGDDPGGVTKATGWQGGGGYRFQRLAPSLLERDKWGREVISAQYNAAMLAEALCKLEGFAYAPSETEYWMQGRSSERDFLYVTTQTLSHEQLRALAEEVGEGRTLLVLCSAWRGEARGFANLTVRKIPDHVRDRCEWGRDDYSLAVEALPEREPEAEAAAPAGSGELFAEPAE